MGERAGVRRVESRECGELQTAAREAGERRASNDARRVRACSPASFHSLLRAW